MYAQVIVDVPTMQTNRPYTYRVPAAMKEILQRGMRVVVPFGKGNRLVQGFVIAIKENAEQIEKLKEVIQVVEIEPVLNEELLQLGAWLADYNFAFQISVLQTMLPNVMRAKYGKVLRVLEPEKLRDWPQVALMFMSIMSYYLNY